MTFENIKDQFAKQAPFFETVGLVLDHVEAGIARAKINNRKDITNHLGSLHAGALFTLGEGTSGAAVLGAFADIADDIRIVSTKATIDYLHIARGLTHCEARLQEPVDQLRLQLDTEGQVDCLVDVRLMSSSDRDVASMTVAWMILKRRDKI